MKHEVIMFNMSSYSEWQRGIVNRNYHIFNYFLNKKDVKRVIAIDFLPFTFKRAIRNYWENIIKGVKGEVVYRDLTTKCVRINRDDVELYIFSTIDSIFSRPSFLSKNLGGFSRPSFLSKNLGGFSHKRVIKKINKVLKRIARLPKHPSAQLTRIVYSCFPMFVNYFSGLKADLTIFDTIDNWIEHPSFKKHQNILKKNYKIITEKSDLIFTVSEGLKDFFKERGRTKNVYWIPNGVDINHFTPRSDLGVGIMDDVLRPIIGYLGTIQHRFDVELLEYLAENNPKKSFVLVGPIWKSDIKEKLEKYKNIYLMGRIPHSQAPDYINCFDVAIIPHRLDEFIKSTYSLKLLEYLSCGRPIVTTPTPDTENFKSVVYRAEKYEDFNQKIDLAIKEDNPSLTRERRERVQRESWEIKIGEMMKRINNC